MLFLFLVYFLTQSNLGGDASPIPQVERSADISCNDPNQCRTIWNIIWSCLSAVFLCTWVTLHPNIAVAPDTRDTGWFKAKLLDFLKTSYLYSYYLKAGEIQRKCNTSQGSPYNPDHFREWTRTHGFFLIMGGFHLYSLPDGATFSAYPPKWLIPSEFVLPPGHLREGGKAEHPLDFKHLSAEALTYLVPTEKEIKDKGKADIIAKILVILQTSWFVAQCIARGVEHLPLTELEVVTLAYATMNAFIYYFWWDKPKDVECPVRVYKASKADGVERGGKNRWDSGVSGILMRIVIYVIGEQDIYFRLSEESQVPMFWSGKPGIPIEMRSMIGASIIGMAFGAIHFIAWNSEFPSHIELLLWRISCVAMTAVPLTVTIICGVMEMDSENTWPWAILLLVAVPLPLTALLYFLSRIATLVMAFTTLRALPSDVFKTVDWTTFIPHL